MNSVSIILILICAVCYKYRDFIKSFFQKNLDSPKDEELKKAVDKLEKAKKLSQEEEIEDNIQLAGECLKDIVRYFIYQLITSVLTAVIAGLMAGRNTDPTVVIVIGSVISIIFSINAILNLWKAGNLLINHKKDLQE
jgi:hypothetical protein